MNIKESFKSRPYWLKGGIIGVIIVFVGFMVNLVGALIFNLIEPPEPIFNSEYPLMFPFIIVSLPFLNILVIILKLFFPISFNTLFISKPIVLVYGSFLLTDIICFFLIGAIIGLIVGKIKFKRVERI